MTNPIQKNSGQSPTRVSSYENEYSYEDQIDSLDDSEFGALDSVSQEDEFQEAQEPSSQGLRSRIGTLKAHLTSNESMDDNQKSSILKKIEVIEGKINYLQSLPPEIRQTQLASLQQKLGDLEINAYGLGESEIDEMASEESENSDYSKPALKELANALKEKIASLEGKVTEEVGQKLRERLDRMIQELYSKDADLNFVGESLSTLDDTVSMVKKEYMIHGKVVDKIGGEEDDEAPVNGSLEALANLTGKSKESILSAFKSAFPNFSGSIDSTEKLAKAIKNEESPFQAPPSTALLTFLKACDPQLGQALSPASKWDCFVIGPAYEKFTARASELLNAIFGEDHNIYVTNPTTSDYENQWPTLNRITFDGVEYSLTDTTQGKTGTLLVAGPGGATPAPSPNQTAQSSSEESSSSSNIPGKMEEGQKWGENAGGKIAGDTGSKVGGALGATGGAVVGAAEDGWNAVKNGFGNLW